MMNPNRKEMRGHFRCFNTFGRRDPPSTHMKVARSDKQKLQVANCQSDLASR